ncbi:hypothetical protein [Iodobacter sp.]|uniref:capsid assembly protein n=1 Tax=Iodobacter sp. TaxID=1915058 RepID=UPI0025EE0458|nr:hypothetical protein [Iodobacter sp.]
MSHTVTEAENTESNIQTREISMMFNGEVIKPVDPQGTNEETKSEDQTTTGPTNEEGQTLQTQFDEATAAAKDLKKDLTEKGINFDELGGRIAENGQLDEADYLALEKAGYPKSLVDAYVAGQSAIADKFTSEVYKTAGGKEGFERLASWAAVNSSSAEIDALNAAVDRGDLATTQMWLKTMEAKRVDKLGTNGSTLEGQVDTKTFSSEAYKSPAEVSKAMRDPRYATDAFYRNEVSNRLANSPVFATI